MDRPYKALTLLLMFVAGSIGSPASAQKAIHGMVTDAETGETLPSANILVKNTYRGTITNSEGRYRLVIPDSLMPARVAVRYVGYKTVERVIESGSPGRQDFALQPSIIQMEELVVTGENPAVRIMREVIRRKQEWRENLDSYKAKAYTRQTLSNDTAMVMVTESMSTAFWRKKKGHREVVHTRKQTANIEADQNFAGVSYLPNFYDDNVEIAGFEVVGVTHPDALDYYDFKLAGEESIDGRRVFEIEVIPDRKLQPLFRGTIRVLDEEYALLDVSLRPNDVVSFPSPVKRFSTDYEQQFNSYGKEYWLPVDMRIDGRIKISMIGLEFPMITFKQVSRITDYQVNVSLPDSLYREDDLMTVDSTAVTVDSLLSREFDTVPLTKEEEQAYETLDSTTTLEKAFKPSGFLARFLDDGDEEDSGGSAGLGFVEDIPGKVSPRIRYNRVDELFAGGRYEISPFDSLDLHFSGNAGYSTGYRAWSYGGGLTVQILGKGALHFHAGMGFQSETASRYRSLVYLPFMTTVGNLFGGRNYYDYYRREGGRVFLEGELAGSDLSAEIGFASWRHRSLRTTTGYDLLGRDRNPLPNPPVREGLLRAVDFRAGYNLGEQFTLGITGMKRIEIGIEHTREALGSDFDYTRYTSVINWSFDTFYQRRFLANTLELTLTGGTFTGDLPIQKFGVIDAALANFAPFGVLKSMKTRPYQGEQYLSAMVEHDFRSIPFELLGLRKPVDWNWGFILFGGAGRTWISDTRRQSLENRFGKLIRESGGWHTEAGISLNGLFGLFRVDLAQRLDRPATIVTVGAARYF